MPVRRAMALVAALVACPSLARAQDPAAGAAPVEEESTFTSVSLALLTPAALPPLDPMTIGGLSLNILYGRSRSTFGIELGAVVNHETDTMGGINVARELTGLQLGAINVAYGNKLPFMVVANAGF